jgi:hypothetical protein
MKPIDGGLAESSGVRQEPSKSVAGETRTVEKYKSLPGKREGCPLAHLLNPVDLEYKYTWYIVDVLQFTDAGRCVLHSYV